MKARKILTLFMAIGFLATGCAGEDADPMREYKDLSDMVPPHSNKGREQGYIPTGMVQIDHEGQTLTFVEGEATEYTFNARLLEPGVSFTLKHHNLPDWVELKATDNPEVYKLVGTAPAMLPASADSTQIGFEVEMVLGSISNPRTAAVLKVVEKRREFTLIVQKTNQQPEILEVSLPDTVELGEGDVPFTVKVKDPAARGGLSPRLDWGYDRTNRTAERPRSPSNGAVYETKDVTKMSNGVFVFHLAFAPELAVQFAEHLKASQLSKEVLETEFFLQVKSRANDKTSAQVPKYVSVRLDTVTEE